MRRVMEQRQFSTFSGLLQIALFGENSSVLLMYKRAWHTAPWYEEVHVGNCILRLVNDFGVNGIVDFRTDTHKLMQVRQLTVNGVAHDIGSEFFNDNEAGQIIGRAHYIDTQQSISTGQFAHQTHHLQTAQHQHHQASTVLERIPGIAQKYFVQDMQFRRILAPRNDTPRQIGNHGVDRSVGQVPTQSPRVAAIEIDHIGSVMLGSGIFARSFDAAFRHVESNALNLLLVHIQSFQQKRAAPTKRIGDAITNLYIGAPDHGIG
jgi:hypothetical protein